MKNLEAGLEMEEEIETNDDKVHQASLIVQCFDIYL